MRVNFAHLCDYALMDTSGKPSVIGIFNFLQAPEGQPFVLNAMLVARFEAPVTEGSTHTIDFVIVNEDGHPVFERKSLKVELNSGGPRRPLGGYLMLRLQNLVISAPGDYVLEIHAQGRRIAEINFVAKRPEAVDSTSARS
jgi:hypothetical protein